MSMYYEDPSRNTVELFYDTRYTEEQIAEFYAGGDHYVLGRHPVRPPCRCSRTSAAARRSPK